MVVLKKAQARGMTTVCEHWEERASFLLADMFVISNKYTVPYLLMLPLMISYCFRYTLWWAGNAALSSRHSSCLFVAQLALLPFRIAPRHLVQLTYDTILVSHLLAPTSFPFSHATKHTNIVWSRLPYMTNPQNLFKIQPAV